MFSFANMLDTAAKAQAGKPQTPNAPKSNYVLMSGESVRRGEPLTRGNARMWIQSDGNLVIMVSGKPVWATGTAGSGADLLKMQSDGNLVLFAGNKAVWVSRTPGHPGALLDLLPDGSAVIYTKVGGQGIWNSRVRPGKLGLPSKGSSLLPDPVKIVKDLGHAASDLVHLKVQKAAQHVGSGVNQITGSSIIQAGWPGIVPAHILNGAVTGGKAGAVKAAQGFLKNPVAKSTYAAVGLVFPPVAPISAGMVAGMEASSRLIDGLESKDPKLIAQAALQLASTQAQAAAGIPGAQRALDIINKTSVAKDLAVGLLTGDQKALASHAALKKQADAGDLKAKSAKHMADVAMAREAMRKNHPGSKDAKAAMKKVAPSLASEVHAALTSPHGIRIGNFAVLSTGRVVRKGRAMKHEPRHKTKKAYDAYMKAHPHG